MSDHNETGEGVVVRVAWCDDCGELSAGDHAPHWALDHAREATHRTSWMEPI